VFIYIVYICIVYFYNDYICSNNNNNYKIYIVPISSKRIELSGVPSTGVGQTHSSGTMQSSSTTDEMEGNLWRISESEKVSFQMVMERNHAIW